MAQVSVFFFALARVSVFTRPPPRSMNFDLRLRNPRMLLDAVDVGEPNDRQQPAQRAQEPEAALPSGGVNQPSEDRREDGQRKILRRVEDGRGAAALRGGKPRGDDAAIAGKDRRLRQPGENAQNKDGRESNARAQVAREGGEEREQRPHDDGDAVDALRSEAIEQTARRQLPERVGPPECEEQIAHALRVQIHVFGHGGGGLRQRRAVSKAEAAHHEENADDEVANASLPRFQPRLTYPSRNIYGKIGDRVHVPIVQGCGSWGSRRPEHFVARQGKVLQSISLTD